MFTTIDKALVAVIMGIIFLVQHFTGFSLSWISAETITTIVALLNPVLVWLVPNKVK
jgi:hypothetical protein